MSQYYWGVGFFDSMDLSVSLWNCRELWDCHVDPLNFSESGWWDRILSAMKALLTVLFCLCVSLMGDEDFEKLKALAEKGDAEAQYELGIMYQFGDGDQKDHKESVKWYRKSAEQGNVSAQHLLGTIYGSSDGVLKDPIVAYAWFNVAQGNGSFASKEWKSKLTKKMTPEQIAEGQKLSIELLKKHPMMALKNREKETKKKFEATKVLAEKGNAEAQFHLGFMYTDGKGVPKDYKEAIKWLRKSAEQGYVSAQYGLGTMYLYGLGVGLRPDHASAYLWWSIAAANRDQKGMEMKNWVAKALNAEQIAKAEERIKEMAKKNPKLIKQKN